MEHGNRRIRVWCLLRDQFAHVTPVEKWLGDHAEFTYDGDWDSRQVVVEKPDIVVCVNDLDAAVCRCIDAARNLGIPSLVIQDGILEWRCQYENPRFGAGGGAPQHQPVIADKIACIGAQSARQIAAWGNASKVEVTGMPRLDDILDRIPRPRRTPGATVLVMTAKKPGFTPEQSAVTLQSLRDVKAALDERPDIRVLWRLTKKLECELGVENRLSELTTSDIVRVLAESDAVISMPSTAMLETMLMDRPVACLDYHNVPRFVPTAWTISAEAHIRPVLMELLNPTARKMEFQRNCLEDVLRCESAAAPRVGELLLRMTGRQVPYSSAAISKESPGPATLAELYPEVASFQISSIVELQARLARLNQENSTLQLELQKRGLGFWVQRTAIWISRRASVRGRN